MHWTPDRLVRNAGANPTRNRAPGGSVANRPSDASDLLEKQQCKPPKAAKACRAVFPCQRDASSPAARSSPLPAVSGPRRHSRCFGAARAVTAFGGGSIFRSARQIPRLPCAAIDEALAGPPRQLKLAWNANAACTVAAAGRKGAGHLRQAQPRCRIRQFRRFDRPVARGDRDRQGGCRYWGWRCAGSSRWSKDSMFASPPACTAAASGSSAPRLRISHSLESLRGKSYRDQRSGEPGEELLFDLPRQKGHRSGQGGRVAPVPGQSARACRREGRSAGARRRSIRAPICGSRTASSTRSRPICPVNSPTASAAFSRYAAASSGANCRWRPRLTRSILEAADRVASDPADAAAVYSGYGGKGSVEDLAAMYRSHTHHNHPVGAALKKQTCALHRRTQAGERHQAKHRSGQVRRADLSRRSELRLHGGLAVSSVVDEAASAPKPVLGFLASPAARSLIGGLAAAAAWLAVAAAHSVLAG